MEYHINNQKYPALNLIIAASDITDPKDDEALEEAIDSLSRMEFEEFTLQYHLLYQKYYVDKIITTQHIQISFHFPLLAKIKKLYYNEFGFSLNEIATIIRKQYIKFYANPEKYLPKDTYQFKHLCIRFNSRKVKDSVTYIHVGVDT